MPRCKKRVIMNVTVGEDNKKSKNSEAFIVFTIL